MDGKLLRCLLILCFLMTSCVSPTEKVSREPAAKKKKVRYAYSSSDKSCDGYPALKVGTHSGTCLGMVVDGYKAGLVMPRSIVKIPGTRDYFVIDMGGWKDYSGALFLLYERGPNDYALKKLKGKLNIPHGLRYSKKDNHFYIGEKNEIVRFRYNSKRGIYDWHIVYRDLPSFAGHMHPLTEIVFDPKTNDLYVNSGAPSDSCYTSVDKGAEYKNCPEVDAKGLAGIYKIPHDKLARLDIRSETGVVGTTFEALGLRNSMAMAIHPSGYLLQGENARDFKNPLEPYEEINVVTLERSMNSKSDYNKSYGWPYCYNFNAVSPEWLEKDVRGEATPGIKYAYRKPLICDKTLREKHLVESERSYRPPHALMPPHVAPLHMEYYKGNLFRGLEGKELLLVSWHGHQPTGNRLVAYEVDHRGAPKLSAVKGASFSIDQPPNCPEQKMFVPEGGMINHARYTEVISQWWQTKNRPEGAPVGFATGHDGGLWVIDDKNKAILRMAKSETAHFSRSCNPKNYYDPAVRFLAWRHALKKSPRVLAQYDQLVKEFFPTEKNNNNYCKNCHGNLQTGEVGRGKYSHLDFLVSNSWFIPGSKGDSKFYDAIAQNKSAVPKMPPNDSDWKDESGKDHKRAYLEDAKGQALIARVGSWIDGMAGTQMMNVEQHHIKTSVSSARNFRLTPTIAGAACGAVRPKTSVYIDPRQSEIIKGKKWYFVKVYVSPSNKALNGKCSYPDDGVFYATIREVAKGPGKTFFQSLSVP